jgi:FixJ family two-component response regulator
LNGLDVYNHIRQTRRNLPVVFVSGNIEFLESIATLKEADPCLDHLSKPCSNTVFAEIVNSRLQ